MDLEPFNAHFSMMTRPSWIGDGVRFLNRRARAFLPPHLPHLACAQHALAADTFLSTDACTALLSGAGCCSLLHACTAASLWPRLPYLLATVALCSCLQPWAPDSRPCMRRQLSSRLFASKSDFNPLFDFLATLRHNGQSLMLNERIPDTDAMVAALEAAERLLSDLGDEVGSFSPACLASGIFAQGCTTRMCPGLLRVLVYGFVCYYTFMS